ncbi:hypothetical protein [Pseudomonas typographi]|uniref:Uncharacterized protein n=1 Tax=Pseudomonas typographi TaxID=2715964 RepID=A0ABR7Z9I2_9PSED|nr:hypothetical protein [Pseudomonas typographi]MBD1555011.1 hypothetical protein [Pseudomonas typographi]MBD1601986.1 hypothetical protein [Pseudomonas typographi]
MAKKATGPKWYVVKELSYIGDRLYRPGEKVQYEGEVGANLEEIPDSTAATAADDTVATE